MIPTRSARERFGFIPKLGSVTYGPQSPMTSGGTDTLSSIGDAITAFMHNYRQGQLGAMEREQYRAAQEREEQLDSAYSQLAGNLLDRWGAERPLDMDVNSLAAIIRADPSLIRNPDNLTELFLGAQAGNREIKVHFDSGYATRYYADTGEIIDTQRTGRPIAPLTDIGKARQAYLDGEISRDEFEQMRRKSLYGEPNDRTALSLRATGATTGIPHIDAFAPHEAEAALVQQQKNVTDTPGWVGLIDPTTIGMSPDDLRRAGINIDLRDETSESLLEGRAAVDVALNAIGDVQQLIAESPTTVGVTGLISRIGNAIGAQARQLTSMFGIDWNPELLDPRQYSSILRESGIKSEQVQSAMVNLAYSVALANNAGKGRLSNQDIERALREISGTAQDPAAVLVVLQDVKRRLAEGYTTRVRTLTGLNPEIEIPDMPLGGHFSPDMPPPPDTDPPPGVPESDWLWMTPEERALWLR